MPRIRAASIDEHKALTRSGLLAAARELIESDGTADISLAEVALAAGVGRTTFYDYFTDREDVIAALVEEELPLVMERLIDSVTTSLPIADRLAALALKTIEFVATDRVFGVILHRDAGRMGPDAQTRIRASHSQLTRELTGLYQKGARLGLFRPMPVAIAGRLIQDTVMSGARLLISGSADLEEVLDHVRQFLLGGLGFVPPTDQ
jgi:AcrR family transcriptional regulator